MMKSLEIHVDASAGSRARRYIEAWHRAELGEAVDKHHLSFESWARLISVFTPRRVALLRHLRRHPAASTHTASRREIPSGAISRAPFVGRQLGGSKYANRLLGAK